MSKPPSQLGTRIAHILKVLVYLVLGSFGVGILVLQSITRHPVEHELNRPSYIIAVYSSDVPEQRLLILETPDQSDDTSTPMGDRALIAVYGPREPDPSRTTSTNLTRQQRHILSDWRIAWCAKLTYLRTPTTQEITYDIAMRCSGYPSVQYFSVPSNQVPNDVRQVLNDVLRSELQEFDARCCQHAAPPNTACSRLAGTWAILRVRMWYSAFPLGSTGASPPARG